MVEFISMVLIQAAPHLQENAEGNYPLHNKTVICKTFQTSQTITVFKMYQYRLNNRSTLPTTH